MYCISNEGKVALVTAATMGIGLASAKALARSGALTYIGGLKDAAAEQAMAECQAEQLPVKFVEFNAKEYDSYEKMIKTIIKNEYKFDILVNNFGIGSPGKDLDLIQGDPQTFFDILHVNIASVYLTCRYAIPFMIEHGGGSIVNIASIGGVQPDISRLGYTTSKAAIIYMTKNIAVQYARDGIRCNVVAPGMIGTNAVKAHMSQEFQTAFLRHVPLNRMGEPDDIANAVIFLASDASSYITGSLQEVAGGYGVPAPEYSDAVEG
ncbi:MAG: SDR family NAD(P)-dependent oxidoreductase [Acidaminococcaceae bacterium]|jgi:3-oxoacyl-[acyl-carrier protein] reductase|nr:SDR family NAD(P)-dependent oxidoreductase [Acidaminococcaceae bacterium]